VKIPVIKAYKIELLFYLLTFSILINNHLKTMIKIHFSKLEANKTYYIDMDTSTIDTPPEIIAIKKKYGYTPRIKAIFKKFVHNPGYAQFYKYTDVNSSEVDYRSGPCNMMNYRSYKYYLPTRDAIVKRWEKDTMNLVLQNIIGDSSFCLIRSSSFI